MDWNKYAENTFGITRDKIYCIGVGDKKTGCPDLSFSPGASCSPDARMTCMLEGCYSVKCAVYCPSGKRGWAKNLQLALANPNEYARQLDAYLTWKRPDAFRAQAHGDWPSQEIFDAFIEVTKAHTVTRFLFFTKKYNLKYGKLPGNVSGFLSTWPTLALPRKLHGMARTWIEGDPRIPEEYFRCQGGCVACKRRCWESKGQFDIVFPKH